MNLDKSKKIAFMLCVGLLTSFLTGIIGAPFFYGLRSLLSRYIYWALFLILSSSVFFLPKDQFLVGFNLFTNLSVGGIFYEWRLKKASYDSSSHASFFMTVFLSFLLIALFVLNHYDIHSLADLKEIYLSPIASLQGRLSTFFQGKIDEKMLIRVLNYTPFYLSLLVISQISFVLYLEKWIHAYLKKPFQFAYKNIKSYKAPSYFMWLSLICLAAYLTSSSLFQKGSLPEVLSLNLILILISVYFFQGFAIIYCVYEHFNFNRFLRVLANVAIFLYLFPLVYAIGFVDYWADVRKKLKKKE